MSVLLSDLLDDVLFPTSTSTCIYIICSVVGTPVPGVDSEHLQPPKQLVSIISHWLESKPQFLYAVTPIDKTDLLSFHGASKTTHPAAPAVSPLAGLIQWCVLAPCHHAKSTSEDTSTGTVENNSTQRKTLTTAASPSSTGTDTIASSVENGKERDKSNKQAGHEEMSFQTLVSKLHANLLSAILSDSQLFLHDTFTSDHVAVTVAALLGLSNHIGTLTQLRRRGRTGSSAEENREQDGEKSEELEESVERLAQFLQISLSTGLLALSAG